jgi:hypothetical protein
MRIYLIHEGGNIGCDEYWLLAPFGANHDEIKNQIRSGDIERTDMSQTEDMASWDQIDIKDMPNHVLIYIKTDG